MNLLERFRNRLHPVRLTCEDVNHFLAAYLDGSMDADVRARFETHLRHCPNCDRYFEQYQATIETVHDAGGTPYPPELVERTLSFLREHLDAPTTDDDPPCG